MADVEFGLDIGTFHKPWECRLLDDHFSGLLSDSGERALRAHNDERADRFLPASPAKSERFHPDWLLAIGGGDNIVVRDVDEMLPDGILPAPKAKA